MRMLQDKVERSPWSGAALGCQLTRAGSLLWECACVWVWWQRVLIFAFFCKSRAGPHAKRSPSQTSGQHCPHSCQHSFMGQVCSAVPFSPAFPLFLVSTPDLYVLWGSGEAFSMAIFLESQPPDWFAGRNNRNDPIPAPCVWTHPL